MPIKYYLYQIPPDNLEDMTTLGEADDLDGVWDLLASPARDIVAQSAMRTPRHFDECASELESVLTMWDMVKERDFHKDPSLHLGGDLVLVAAVHG